MADEKAKEVKAAVTTKENPKTSAEAAPAAAAGEEKAKRKPPVREPKFKTDMKITLLSDKDGKVYGKDHNPKRAGSKAGERFALYINGMTVDQALAAGITRGDLDFDAQKKFISIA